MLRAQWNEQQKPLEGSCQTGSNPQPAALPPLLLKITREPGLEIYTVTFPDGSSEEVDAVDAFDFLRTYHAGLKMDEAMVGKALDQAWNFGSVELLINKPRKVIPATTRITPKVGWE